MKVFLSLLSLIIATSAFAAPRTERLRMPSGPLTNSFEIAGVKFPPRYTEEQFRMRKVAFEAFHQELKRIEAIAEETFQSQLTEEHRKVLLEISRQQEEEYGRMRAEAAARYAELVAITNRAVYIKKDWHDKRRSEYEFHEGLYWLGEPVIKETVTRTENGKIVVHILYTLGKDGKEKRHRYDPAAIEKLLNEKGSKK